MTQMFQHLFLQFATQPREPRLDGFVTLAGGVGEFLQRTFIDVSRLDQFAFVRRETRQGFAKNF